MSDLATRSSQSLSAAVDALLVVAGQLLCSRDSALRLTLPDLRPSEKWAYVGPPQQRTQVMSLHDGWLIDGVLFDRELSRPLMLLAVSMRSQLESGEYWGREPPQITDGTRLTYASCFEVPLFASAVWSAPNSRSEIGAVRVIVQGLDGAPRAELQLGDLANLPYYRPQFGADNSGLTDVPLYMHAKSRGLLAGFGLALLGPIGLLIATMLPAKSPDSAAHRG